LLAPYADQALRLLDDACSDPVEKKRTMSQQPRRILRVALLEAVVLAVGVLVLVLLALAVEGNAHLITSPFRLQ
jgi:hypothetical protein